jgi:predicted transposase/invertase (TIGR01784 family)
MINNIIKKLPLTSDIVFKRVFSREGNEDILKALLEAILEIPIQDVTVKNPELPRNLYESKAGVLDVKVEIDKDKICDIEMQVKDLKNIDKRSTYYMSKILSDELKKSEDYIAVKNTIVINLLNFEFYKRNSYHSIAHMKFEKTKENEYIDMGYQNEDEIATKELEMHFIEIPKFIKKNPKATTKLEQWLWLIAGRRN